MSQLYPYINALIVLCPNDDEYDLHGLNYRRTGSLAFV